MHLLSTKNLTQKYISDLFIQADWFRQGNLTNCNKILATLFYEPSTRTRLSFESAMLRLGGKVLSVENANESSSSVKKESLADTLKTISQLADIIVVRHPSDIIDSATTNCTIPVINGGSGSQEHPSQALLDLYTIYTYHKNLEGLKIMFTGDLVASRTIKSLLPLLKLYDIQRCDELVETDVLYMTRHQQERVHNQKSDFVLNGYVAETMKKTAIIMHPLPRNEELLPEVDENPRAVYFEQVKLGMFLRMALLHRMARKL